MIPWIDTSDIDPKLAKEYPELWAEIHRLFPGLSQDNKVLVLKLVTETCPYCHAANRWVCNCMRDD